jgi:hypothetical protein
MEMSLSAVDRIMDKDRKADTDAHVGFVIFMCSLKMFILVAVQARPPYTRQRRRTSSAARAMAVPPSSWPHTPSDPTLTPHGTSSPLARWPYLTRAMAVPAA